MATWGGKQEAVHWQRGHDEHPDRECPVCFPEFVPGGSGTVEGSTTPPGTTTHDADPTVLPVERACPRCGWIDDHTPAGDMTPAQHDAYLAHVYERD